MNLSLGSLASIPSATWNFVKTAIETPDPNSIECRTIMAIPLLGDALQIFKTRQLNNQMLVANDQQRKELLEKKIILVQNALVEGFIQSVLYGWVMPWDAPIEFDIIWLAYMTGKMVINCRVKKELEEHKHLRDLNARSLA